MSVIEVWACRRVEARKLRTAASRVAVIAIPANLTTFAHFSVSSATNTRLRPDISSDPFNQLNVEVLFNDDLVAAAGTQTRWASRRKIDLAANERWILSAPNTWNYQMLAEAFRARGLDMPKVSPKTLSVHLRTNLLATGQFVTAFPRSVLNLYAARFVPKILPLELPVRPWPVVIVTLRHRTLTPVVERFIECARALVKPLTAGSKV
jgi:DNA-binding transcriptional LysR family regulator